MEIKAQDRHALWTYQLVYLNIWARNQLSHLRYSYTSCIVDLWAGYGHNSDMLSLIRLVYKDTEGC
jgi:hypothetical protein